MKAAELIKDPWVRCQDLPLSVYESASTYHRNKSCDNRNKMFDKENIADLHNRAVEQLVSKSFTYTLQRDMGYKTKDIENSLKGTENNRLAQNYQRLVDKQIVSLSETTSPLDRFAH